MCCRSIIEALRSAQLDKSTLKELRRMGAVVMLRAWRKAE